MKVQVQPYDWDLKDNFSEDGRLEIRAWCLNRDSEPVLLRIHDYHATCYIELPTLVNGRPFRWDFEKVEIYKEWLRKALGDHAPITMKAEYKHKFYYYQPNKKYHVLHTAFKSEEARLHCERLLAKPRNVFGLGFIYCRVWEDKIPTIRKLLTSRKSGFSQWIEVEGEIPLEPVSTLKHEYMVNWEKIDPLGAEMTAGWMTHPSVLSWDIETYSDNHKAMPNRHHPKHLVYLLSCVCEKWVNGAYQRQRYCILVGDCADSTDEKFRDSIVLKVETEQQLIARFSKLIVDFDPDVLIGYNILGYDYGYLDARLQRKLGTWGVLGRIKDEKSKMYNKSWQSSGYGHNTTDMLIMAGRISIDLLPIIRRDHKLDKYDLDTVSNKFLGRGKHPVKAVQMFQAYEAWMKAKKDPEALEGLRKVVDYCFEDSDLVIDLFKVLNTWIGLIELSNVVGVKVVDLFTRGQQIRCLSQIYDLASSLGYIIDERKTDAKSYAGGFVYPPVPGLYENVICLDFASLYPSIMEESNICYTTLVHPDDIDRIPDEECHVITSTEEIEPEDEKDEDDPLSLEDQESTPKPVQTITYRDKFVRKERRLGVLPQLVHRLVAERKYIRDVVLKQTKDPVQRVILDARQLALKVSANSMYGFLGVQNGLLPLFEGARYVTARGRNLITAVNEYLKEKHGAKIVYNDTDSSMVDMGITDSSQTNKIGQALALEISGQPDKGIPGLFPPPLRMEYEKGMRLLCLKKKKYAAALIKDDGSIPMVKKFLSGEKITGKDLLVRGIVLAQRAHCKWLREIYEIVLMNIICRQPMLETLKKIVATVEDLLAGRVPIKRLAGIKELGASYKNASFPMKIFSDNLRKWGTPANPGDRLEFVVVEDPESRLMGGRMRLLESYLEMENPPPIDVNYYVEKVLCPPIEQLWSIGYQQELSKMTTIGYKPKTQHHWIGIDHPIKIMVRMMADQVPISKVIELITNPEPPKPIKITIRIPPKPTGIVNHIVLQ